MQLLLLAMLCVMAWLSWSGFRAEQMRRSWPHNRLQVTAYETVAGAAGKTTEAHVTLRNIGVADVHAVTLEMDCHAPGVGRTEWPREFVVEIPSGATVRLPAWELGVSLEVGTSFECRVMGAK